MKKKIQIVKFAVTSANQRLKIDTETEISHKNITGVFATVSNKDALDGSTLQLSVDENEILPKDFELSLVSPTSALSMQEVVYPMTELANGSRISGEYNDSGKASYPYDVRLYFIAEAE